MKKGFYLLICLVIFSGFVSAMEIQGGVTYNVDSAREYVQEGQNDSIQISRNVYFNKDDKTASKIVYSYNNVGDVIGVTVQYKDEPSKAYIYGRNYSLKYVDTYDKDVSIYPHRGYRYDLSGKLILMSLTVSPNEQFRFSPGGELIAHAVNGIIYDENGKVIGTASGK